MDTQDEEGIVLFNCVDMVGVCVAVNHMLLFLHIRVYSNVIQCPTYPRDSSMASCPERLAYGKTLIGRDRHLQQLVRRIHHLHLDALFNNQVLRKSEPPEGNEVPLAAPVHHGQLLADVCHVGCLLIRDERVDQGDAL